MKSAKYWVEKLNLVKHPEGGWYREIYRSDIIISGESILKDFKGVRNCSTSIYYLLENEDFSAFHRIKSDEIWHYYAGTSAVEIISIDDGELKKQCCGNNFEEYQQFQVIVRKNTWFAARLQSKTGYALVGCTVAPGFHFDDFEMADEELIKEFPQFESEILKLTRFK